MAQKSRFPEKGSGSFLLRNSDFFAEFYHSLNAISGVFQDIPVQNGGILFQQQNHRGAAELEVALLLAAPDGGRAVVVDDLSHQQSAHLHCDDVAELPTSELLRTL